MKTRPVMKLFNQPEERTSPNLRDGHWASLDVTSPPTPVSPSDVSINFLHVERNEKRKNSFINRASHVIYKQPSHVLHICEDLI